ncbi:S-layer homology domain-containing protein [Paenibacillus andongensis]|uniref:S-layer homology domain-containing protein n=1 Tax=Paenibacillus andongensis TaxID=2975482 RepID=UPI0021BAD78D|nr:S-layer homology domain-containing protein [Paenibacillus andongensis]
MNRKVKQTYRKLLSFILGTLIFLSGVPYMGAPMVAQAAAEQWVDVGSAGISPYSGTNTMMTIDSSGTPYVVYRDGGRGGNATVKKYNGSAWVNVGSAGFGAAAKISIAIDSSDTPYVVFMDTSNSSKATVMKYNGSSWVNVGSAVFSEGAADYPSIAIDISGTPYVVYRDGGNSNKATVMKYNGSSWENVGSAGFSSGDARYTSIAIDSTGTPYVVYQDVANSYKATVMKYNGSSWENVGSAGFSKGYAYYTMIAIDSSGTRYVVFKDDFNSEKASVMKYSGNSWVNVGSAGFSAGPADQTSIAIDSSGTLYVAYADWGNNKGKATVMKFNGSSWVNVGSAGFSADIAISTSIVIDSSGTPYVAYSDLVNSYKATVKKLTMTYTLTYEGNIATSGSAPTDSITYQSGDTAAVQGNTGDLVKTGYTFAGWNTKADGTGTDYVAGAPISIGSADVTLYAKWTMRNAATPNIITQPTDQTVIEGASSPALSIAATVSDSGTLSYQWYSNTASSNSGGTMISGATSALYAAPTTTAGTTYYYVVVTNTDSVAGGSQTATATSSVATVTVNALINAAMPSIGTQPTGATVNEGGSSPALSVAATVSDSGTLSYQWYSNTASSNSGGAAISGATSASYSAPTTTAGTTYYYVVVTNTNSGATGSQTATATSSAVSVTVNALINAAMPSIGTQPMGATVNEGGSNPALSVAATVSDGGTLSYQWYSNTASSNSGGALISGATSASYAAPTTTAGTTYYYVVVTNTNSGATGSQTATATSSVATVTVNALRNAAMPSIGTQPAGATVNEGGSSPALSVAATVSDGGTLSYQWYSNTANSTTGGTAIGGATSASYAAPTLAAGTTYYYVVVTNTNSGATGSQTATATSSVATVTVNALTNAAMPSFGTQPTGATVNEGDSSPSLSVAATVSDSGTLSYQWYSNTASSNSGGAAISGATSASYAAPTLAAGTTYYYVVVTNTNSGATGSQTTTATSSVAKLTVTAANSSAPLAPTGLTAIAGNGQVALTWNGVSETVTYSVYKGTASGSYDLTSIATVSGATYSYTGLTNGTTYYFAVKASNARGNSGYSNEVIATPQAAIPSASSNANLSSMAVSGLTLSPSFDTRTFSYTASVANGVTLATVTPTISDSNATVKVNRTAVTSGLSSGAISLNVGINPITVVVTAQDGKTTQTYTVNVIRAAVITASSTTPIQVTTVPVSITVPSGVTNAKISATSVTVGSNKEATLPLVEVQAATTLGNVSVTIPDGTKIMAPANWDGTINLPQVLSNSSVRINSGVVSAVIEVGSTDVSLTFDKAVRLLIPNQGGKRAGFVRNGVFTEITEPLSADTQAAADKIAEGGDAKITVGSDLVIWTKHFTKFASYTKVDSPSETGSSGVYGGGATNSATIAAVSGGTTTLNGVTIEVPAGSMASNIQVTVDKVSDASILPVNSASQLVSEVYEIKKDKDGDFSKPVVITLPFDKTKVDFAKLTAGVYWLNEQTHKWVPLDSQIVDEANVTASGSVSHFTKFAVLVSEIAKTVQPQTNETDFADIKGHWSEANVRELVKLSAINGYTDKSFKPNANITRAEFVTVIVKAFHLGAQDGKTFADTETHWAKSAIATAAAAGIVAGYSDNSFGPDDLITREQMAAIVVRAAKLAATDKSINFPDSADISDWARSALATAIAKGLINGYEDGTVKPKVNTTRAEAVTVILRALTAKP